MKPELRNVIRIAESVLIGTASLVSPNIVRAQSQLTVNSDECIKQPQGDLILLGGQGCFGRLNILLVSQNGTTLAMLTEVKEDLVSIDPMQEVLANANIYGLLNAEDLGCDQNAQCDWNNGFPRVKSLINRIAVTGMIPHETMIVIKSNDEGGTGYAPIFPPHSAKPDIYSPSAVVRPVDTRGSNREVAAMAVTHEFLHQFAGFGHEGGDIMRAVCNCINAQHARFLRGMTPLIPFNYAIPPQLEFKPIGTSTFFAATETYQPSDMSFAFAVQSPADTTQLYAELRPFNNDGAGVFDYARGSLAIQAWRDAGSRIPAPPQWYGLLPDMTYTWKVHVSNLLVPIVDQKGKVIPADPRWTQVEAWPGIFLEKTSAEIKIHTPATTLDTISLNNIPTTNDLTPTLTWENANKQIFYYEVQVSKDPTFNTDPATATAMIYWELRHGGVTNPENSYTIPNNFPLEKGTDYFWRIRPRVQGDGKPMEWTPAAKFATTVDAKIMAYSRELIDKDYGQGVKGPSEQDYNNYASKEPEYVKPSSLARVINKPNGQILIPEEGAKDYSNSSVKPASLADYRAYLRAEERRLQRQKRSRVRLTVKQNLLS